MRRRGGYRTQFGQRLGWYSAEFKDRFAGQPPRIWLQAVSVGEMLIALKLIATLRQRSPELPLILSTTTTTGLQLAKERAGDNVEVIYTPIDLLPVVRRAYRVLKPASVVVVDGGLWPNLLSEAKRRKVPTALVNARLSPRSEHRFGRFSFLSRTLFQQLDMVCVPEESDLRRWARLGVPADRLHLTGSIKYDDQDSGGNSLGHTEPRASTARHAKWQTVLSDLGISPDRPILLAGSTHPGEERIVTSTYLALREQFPDLFLIIVPRHVERTASIVAELTPFGVQIARRTAAASAPTGETAPGASTPPELLLVDTTGELREWYAAATVVFIGKSLTAIGGQNPAEAIMAGKPVITGPHMENFSDLIRTLKVVDAVIQVDDEVALSEACAFLLANAERRAQMAEAASRQLETHRGAAMRSAALVLKQARFFTC